MQITIQTDQQRQKYMGIIQQLVAESPACAVKYLDFGAQVIRLVCYVPEILSYVHQQMSFVLKDTAPAYDKTLIVGRVRDVAAVACQMDDTFNPKINLRIRIATLQNQHQYPDIDMMDRGFSDLVPQISLRTSNGTIEAYESDLKTCYYLVRDIEPEEFIKLGHVFVQQLNVLLKNSNTNLTHGAVLGYNGQGALLCARGQRGKSTLTVHSLINGCDYVSDDYQLLSSDNGDIYADPLYSIITLSPGMYQRMYEDFNGKFCCNNARKDKYVFNISAYHDQFQTRYPIKVCLFPEIVAEDAPKIVPCSVFDKGRAVVQFIHSTVFQMRDLPDAQTIKKLFDMVCDLPFYKFYLGPDIAANTACLRQFLSTPLPAIDPVDLPQILADMTFDVAYFLDTQTYTFYTMNKFATNLYEMLLFGISADEIRQELSSFFNVYAGLKDDFDRFVQVIEDHHLLSVARPDFLAKPILNLDFMKECAYKLSIVHTWQQELVH